MHDVANAFAQLTRTLAGRDNSVREFWVVCTGAEGTAAALTVAGPVAEEISAKLYLLATEVVPYPLPLDRLPRKIERLERDLVSIALLHGVEADIQILVCRDRIEALDKVLPPCAIVFLGGRKQWWRTGEQRLARALKRRQRSVFFLDPRQK